VEKMGRQICAEEGYACPEENHWSEADECSHAEEIVGNDEGALGCDKEGGLIDECFRTSRTFVGACSSAGVL
jgi:hypothetical protein